MRTPCCEKMGLKKGPWTAEEDQILISFIQRYGHENWRALPKQAGLLRCGKSCRLRWTNYLRPDIKRGNFSKEEEETIIKLHQVLGNRWSAIATRLPGRTDNEIKNFWNTHLKKRLKQNLVTGRSNQSPGPVNFSLSHLLANQPVIPTQKLPENFSVSDSQTAPNYGGQCTNVSDHHQRHSKRETKDSSMISTTSKFRGVLDPSIRLINSCSSESTNGNPSTFTNGDMAFWYNLLIKSGESQNMYNQEM